MEEKLLAHSKPRVVSARDHKWYHGDWSVIAAGDPSRPVHLGAFFRKLWEDLQLIQSFTALLRLCGLDSNDLARLGHSLDRLIRNKTSI